MKAGAFDYLLKVTLEKSELQRIIEQVKESCVESSKNDHDEYEAAINKLRECIVLIKNKHMVIENQRIIAGNAQFTGIAAGRGVGFTTGLLLLREGLGMRETPIRPHSWH